MTVEVDLGNGSKLGLVGCPLDGLITETGWLWRRQYSWLRRGDVGFWYPGPADSQPAMYLRAMEEISAYVGGIEAAAAEARKRHVEG